MAIKFTCPHCECAILVRDQLAGKRGKCKSCKKVITIPMPRQAPAAGPAPPQEEVEQLAASAFGDEPPPPEETRETRTIDFNCPHCDEPVQVSIELQGKQTPCTACGRIIKVPLLQKRDPTDWRKIDTKRPSMARPDAQPEPEGAWGSTISTERVSKQALLEAGVIPTERERLTPRQWITRITIAVVVLVVVGGGTLWGVSWWSKNRLNRMVAGALEQVSKEPKSPKLSPEKDAALHLAAGEYYLRVGKKESTAEALKQFQTARSFLELEGQNLDRDALLIELALAQVELGGSQAEVDKGTRLKWEDTRREVLQTLQKIGLTRGTVTARVQALQFVVRKMLDKGQAQLAFSLASELSHDRQGQAVPPEVAEATVVAALELQAAGRNDLADQLAGEAQKMYAAAPPDPENPRPAKDRPIDAPALIGYILLGSDKKAQAALPPEPSANAPVDPVPGLGYITAWARTGKLDKARPIVEKLSGADARLQGQLLVATAGQGSTPEDLTRALDFAEDELKKGTELNPWLLLRLAQVAVNAGMDERVLGLAEKAGKDKALAGHMQLEVVRARLQKGSFDPALFGKFDGPSTAHALAREAAARYAAHKGEALAKEVDSWDESVRPFGQLGVALGSQDK